MTHYEVTELASDYLDETLEAAQKAELETHLASCASCRGLLDDIRLSVSACRSAAPLEPSFWLTQRILQRTTGELHAGQSWQARLRVWMRPALRQRLVYGIAMSVFSLSFILFTARVKLRAMNLGDLNPATWVRRANSRGHVLMARAEKVYYDLRFVYEVQTVLHELGKQSGPNTQSPQKPQRPGNSSRILPLPQRQLVFLAPPPAAGPEREVRTAEALVFSLSIRRSSRRAIPLGSVLRVMAEGQGSGGGKFDEMC
jgi:hypothetical protein